ncbi:MAG: helix-turn-helix transcriptional regulator [Ruminococcus sp.]|nr:helix-turn-helix transcriptional regulator [Ruminococcus sp.]
MNTGKELNYRLYVQKMSGFTRTPFSNEMARYIDIQQGNVEEVRARFENARINFSDGKGQLSDDPVRNIRYHFIVSVAVIARVCVAAGMGHDEAYTLGDIYIRKADLCNDQEELLDLFAEMRIDFAQRMHDMKKNNVISIHIRKCIDYIYDNLHEDLTVRTLSLVVGLDSSYLSKLFAKETGTTIKRFITRAKISTAENLLKYSEYSCSEISFALGFSSQSAFISVFKKENGMTPKQYRDRYASAGVL